ncbi:MAG: hypothetical protein BJ554DRAFT_2452, partial [Olpidium bornovanus]
RPSDIPYHIRCPFQGWIECVGCADRSAYDLSVHAKRTGVPLIVREQLAEPVTAERWLTEFNRKAFGMTLKKAAKPVEERILAMDQCQLETMAEEMKVKGSVTITVDTTDHTVTSEMVTVEKRVVTENVREYTPNVIEPSFGIGRILYSLIEHLWWIRDGDGARSVFSFPASIAPCKVLLLPLSGHESLIEPTRQLCKCLEWQAVPVLKLSTAAFCSAFPVHLTPFCAAKKIRRLGIAMRTDDSSASVGKRYARNDELGTPFGITVDFQTVKDNTITLRERDSTKQIRETVQEARDMLFLCSGGRHPRGSQGPGGGVGDLEGGVANVPGVHRAAGGIGKTRFMPPRLRRGFFKPSEFKKITSASVPHSRGRVETFALLCGTRTLGSPAAAAIPVECISPLLCGACGNTAGQINFKLRGLPLWWRNLRSESVPTPWRWSGVAEHGRGSLGAVAGQPPAFAWERADPVVCGPALRRQQTA